MGTPERLIESTRELLWERGYVGTSPKAIQQRAGAGQGSMYHHFAGKEALAAAAFQRNAEAVFAKASNVLAGEGGPLGRLTAYLTLPRDVLRGCPVGRMAGDADVLDSPALVGVLEKAFDGVRELMVEVVGESVAAGG